MRSLEKEKVQVHKNQILNEEEFFERKNIRRNINQSIEVVEEYCSTLYDKSSLKLPTHDVILPSHRVTDYALYI